MPDNNNTSTHQPISLETLVNFCDTRTRRREVTDFPGAINGLQFAKQHPVQKIGAAVDAGLVPFQEAARQGVDFLIVHHGLFWHPQQPVTGAIYEKYRLLIENDIAVYSCHLPLDAHPEIGNNALLAAALHLPIQSWFLPHEGVPMAALCTSDLPREELSARLRALFPSSFTAIEFGSTKPSRIAILTGSGRSALSALAAVGCDTLITGELRQEHFNAAQENRWNLYPCGHYATEVFGVTALAKEAATHFRVPFAFIPTSCPL
ncbi:MAG: Nif3-like dinuclear metal center hexameric protein [Puniceicoccales bacterium]|jgi:dinuclear metal center YbgI/SA1388 family protein|nr:Nif3-like dinuclear metal center hexameric protein [Puniceicoccales bacterium]